MWDGEGDKEGQRTLQLIQHHGQRCGGIEQHKAGTSFILGEKSPKLFSTCAHLSHSVSFFLPLSHHRLYHSSLLSQPTTQKKTPPQFVSYHFSAWVHPLWIDISIRSQDCVCVSMCVCLCHSPWYSVICVYIYIIFFPHVTKYGW